ncbi:MAG: Hsp70 family protein, partial [Pseudomonadota bacterium]
MQHQQRDRHDRGRQGQPGHALQRQLLQSACAAKESLTNSDTADINIELEDGSHWQGALTREMLDELLEPLIHKTLMPCRRALRDAGIGVEDVHDLVMVGGSTRVLKVRSLVGDAADLTGIQFDQTIDLTTPEGQSLRNAIIHVAQEMNGALGDLNDPVA